MFTKPELDAVLAAVDCILNSDAVIFSDRYLIKEALLTAKEKLEAQQSSTVTLISQEKWNANKDAETETDAIYHVCSYWRPEDCDCQGNCSCHWER
jgi:hypothetical protein